MSNFVFLFVFLALSSTGGVSHLLPSRSPSHARPFPILSIPAAHTVTSLRVTHVDKRVEKNEREGTHAQRKRESFVEESSFFFFFLLSLPHYSAEVGHVNDGLVVLVEEGKGLLEILNHFHRVRHGEEDVKGRLCRKEERRERKMLSKKKIIPFSFFSQDEPVQTRHERDTEILSKGLRGLQDKRGRERWVLPLS